MQHACSSLPLVIDRYANSNKQCICKCVRKDLLSLFILRSIRTLLTLFLTFSPPFFLLLLFLSFSLAMSTYEHLDSSNSFEDDDDDEQYLSAPMLPPMHDDDDDAPSTSSTTEAPDEEQKDAAQEDEEEQNSQPIVVVQQAVHHAVVLGGNNRSSSSNNNNNINNNSEEESNTVTAECAEIPSSVLPTVVPGTETSALLPPIEESSAVTITIMDPRGKNFAVPASVTWTVKQLKIAGAAVHRVAPENQRLI
jgi:hypothetical protein